ncbi:hypothetical protein [Streptomyces sp. NPDC049916]|uniref:hypothetical protein n=1 Tax=Streptomyces sp. NPDC049916 TaxID=3155156 RepID=UPI003434ECAC
MADEHDEWLDKDAAEKLLRGEPVAPVGDRARDDALRLAEALDAARGGGPTGGPLPGEDAVLAAFRQAAHGDGAFDRLAGRTAGAALPGQPGMLHSVHLGQAPAAQARRPRRSRPVRFGLAVSLAGVTLGGVAVATGTGMFSGSFGGQGAPAPATSVSAAVTPEPLASDLPTEDPPSPADPSPPDGPEVSSSPAPSESAGSGEDSGDPSGEATGPERGGDPTGGADRPGGSGGEDTSGSTLGGEDRPDGRGDDTSRNWYEKSVKACKAFRDGTLDERSRRQLIEMAKGERNLERFCDRLLGEHGGGGGNGGGSGGSGGSGGDDDGDHNGPGNGGGGQLPPVSFHPVPRPTAPEAGDRFGADAVDAVAPAVPLAPANAAAPPVAAR